MKYIDTCKHELFQHSYKLYFLVFAWLAHADSTTLREAYTGFDVMLSEKATDSDNIVKPDSEKKLLCVERGLRTKSCTQSRTRRTSFSVMATLSRLIIIFSTWVAGPRVTRIVNWKTWSKETHNKDRITHKGRSNMLCWTRYILYTGPDERVNQPVQNKMTGRHLRQGGSSWMTPPAAAFPAQRTSTQPGTLQLRSPWFNFSPEAQPKDCWTTGRERRHHHQPQVQGRSSSDPVLLLISKQRATKHNSQILR